MNRRRCWFQFLLGISLLILHASVWGQEVRININGTLSDSLTKSGIEFATVAEKGVANGTTTDIYGKFSLRVKPGSTLVFSCVGYHTKEIKIGQRSHHIEVKMLPSEFQLNEVVVKPKRERYKRKDNPAVKLAKNVIAHKNDHSPSDHEYYNYERYDQTTYYLYNFDGALYRTWKKNFDFVDEYIDTSKFSGSAMLPISTEERIETCFHQREGEKKRTRVDAAQHAGFNDMIPEEILQLLKTEVFPEPNIYENDIYIFTTKLVSPLSALAPTFYKFYIVDTLVDEQNKPYIDLLFAPLSPEALGFIGHLYIDLDSTYFVRRAELNVSKNINLNFVQNMQITIEQDRLPDSTRMVRAVNFESEVNLNTTLPGVYARRSCVYSNFSFDKPTDKYIFLRSDKTFDAPDINTQGVEFWEAHRAIDTTSAFFRVNHMYDRMRQVKRFYYSEKLMTILFKGYIPIGNKAYEENNFLFGPLNALISHNAFEGWRFRGGGMTTAALNNQWFLSGYAAYGTKDYKWKGDATLEYSFTQKKLHSNEFPIHSLKLEYTYDTKLLGQYTAISKDNILSSIVRSSDSRLTYMQKSSLTYTHERWNGFSYHLQFSLDREYATPLAPFTEVGDTTNHPYHSLALTILQLRYAPNERFIQSRTSRMKVNNQAPVFLLVHTAGWKDVLYTDFDYQRTDFSFTKRFWLSAFGHLDVKLKAGKIWTQVPYTMLCLPNANLSYFIRSESFSQMNAMEFIFDQYASWNLVYSLKGLLFNHIPLLRKLKWREVVSFRGIYGGLSDKNDPYATNEDGSWKNPHLYLFPEMTLSHTSMENTPYMEAAFGIENIFRFFRVDYVRRLTHLNHKNATKHGIQFAIAFNF